MRILVINGPNLNMLGIREPGIYGKNSFTDLLDLLEKAGKETGTEVTQYQSNHEVSLSPNVLLLYFFFLHKLYYIQQ